MLVCQFRMKYAANDFLSQMQLARTLTNATGPTAMIQTWHVGEREPLTCQNQRLGNVAPRCVAVPVIIILDLATTLFANGSLGSSYDPLNDNSAATTNAMQIILALAQVDLGNVYPNNVRSTGIRPS